eukprot:scaffold227794_cov19-Tisochrysis_lutea.AAC.2
MNNKRHFTVLTSPLWMRCKHLSLLVFGDISSVRKMQALALAGASTNDPGCTTPPVPAQRTLAVQSHLHLH